jgi:uncharacterized protein (DUF58 family)
MITSELQAHIRELELVARRILKGQIAGDVKTKIKGAGFEFDKLRDYAQGDDTRFIDWKATARTQKMLTRQYLEDKQKTVWLVVDLSASTEYGSQGFLKSDIIKQIATILAFIGLYHKDSVGLLLFSDNIEYIVKPGTARSHIMHIINLLYTHKPVGRTTDINSALQNIMRTHKNGAYICIISDFYDDFDMHLLHSYNHKHELFLFRCIDPLEERFPSVGLLSIEDSETGALITVNTREIKHKITQKHEAQDSLWRKMGIAHVTCKTTDAVINQISFFLKKYAHAV